MRTVLFWLIPGLLLAGGPTDPSVTVTGAGSVDREPGFARLVFRVTAQAEEAKDAVVKYREKVEKMQEALKKAEVAPESVTLGPPSMTTGQGDASAAIQAMVRGRGQDTASPMVTMSSVMDVKIAWAAGTPPADGLAKVATVLDAVVEAGADNTMMTREAAYYGIAADAGGPPSPAVIFDLDDHAALREEAYAKAVEDARAQAAALAGRLGRRVGAALRAHVLDGTAGKDDAASLQGQMIMKIYGVRAGAIGEKGSASPRVTESVHVEVEFALEP